jgi:SSS family solute:Na+ symporter
MQTLDWVVVAGYFVILFSLAWWVVRQSRNTTDDYFLAGRNLGWFVIGASIFAANIGSEHLVGLAGSGCTDGVAMAHYELHAWCLLVLAWVLVPYYLRSRVFTMPEFLEKRFSPAARYVLSVISIIAYVLTKIAVGIFAGGVVFSALLPEMKVTLGGVTADSFWIGSVAVVVLTGIYTVLGGLRAVAYTEALQTVVFIIGSALVSYFGLKELGGWEELRRICGPTMFNLWRPLVPTGVEGTWAPVLEKAADGTLVRQAWYFNANFPWLGMVLCAPIVGLWYWCTDQYIVQRVLGAPDERGARRGALFSALLKLLPVFLFIIPGMICFALAETSRNPAIREALFEGDKLVAVKAQAAFPLMVQHALPVGVRGMVVAGLLAALMSSLAGVFNATSTLFTIDLYSKWKPKASQAELVWMGRMATIGAVVIGLMWIPVIRGAQGLYFYLQGVQGYLAPPIFAVFFFGVFFRRLNAAGCLAALSVGFLLGLFRLGVDTPVSLGLAGFEKGYPQGSFLWIVNNIYFQYYSAVIFLVSTAVLFLVSFATAAPSAEKVQGLTYGTASPEQKAESRASWNAADVLASLAVLAAIAVAYLYFTG